MYKIYVAIGLLWTLQSVYITAQNNVGIGISDPQEKLDLDGGIRLRNAIGQAQGTIRFLNGQFEGNVDSTGTGWRPFYGPWVKSLTGDYFLSPVAGGPSVAIGDSLFTSDGKLTVKGELASGGTGIHTYLTSGIATIAETKLAHQYVYAPGNVWTFGLRTEISNDFVPSSLSMGVAGFNFEVDTTNYGGFFAAHGAGDYNIGVYASALNGLNNWAGYFDGRGYFSDQVGIGTDDPTHQLHILHNQALRLEGTEGLYHHGAQLNFGDGDYVVISEPGDDTLSIYGSQQVGITSDSKVHISSPATFVSGQLGVGIGTNTFQEKLQVGGGIRIGDAIGQAPGTIRFVDGKFEGNVDSTSSGWQPFDSPWRKTTTGNYYLSPVTYGGSAAIGDSVFTSDGKLIVKRELSSLRTGIHTYLASGPSTIAEARLGYQYHASQDIIANFGVLGVVHHDAVYARESFGVAGNNMEQDSANYGGYFISQGNGDNNIGVYANALHGLNNWAGYFEGSSVITEQLCVGTVDPDSLAKVHIKLPPSGNFAHLRIESPGDYYGFGIMFKDTLHEFMLGQNIGNWNDGRFSVYSGSSFNGLAMLQNGDIGLTTATFVAPFARFQVPQKGSLNNADTLEVSSAAIFIGETSARGMAFDENQIETVGSDLYLNYNSGNDIRLAQGGGKVGVIVDSLIADFHIGEGKTVLFGNDTTGKSDFFPDAKFMWKPGRGGAIRIGQLNADGSLIGGTGYDYWDDSNVGWASVAIGNNTKASGAGSVALGIRAYAGNFGSVALGHLSRTLGNSGVAAGYYTRADAFVSTAVGAANTGGGNPSSWIATDAIFEVGNSIDTSNRHNALTVLKNARVGINHSNPQSMLDIEQPNSGPGNGVLMNLAGHGHWETVVDNANDYNFYYNNTLKAYILDTDGAYVQNSDRRLKQSIEPIGQVLDKLLLLKPVSYAYKSAPDASPSVGFIAQDVLALFPELVVEKNGFLGINYQGFSVLAIKGLQEATAQNARLEKEVDMLRSEIAALAARMDQQVKE